MGFENINIAPSSRAPVVGVIDPDAYAAATYTSAWVSLAEFHWVMAVVMAGTLGASATLDAKIEQATDSSGTGAKDVSGKAITQLTQAGSDSDKQAIINVTGADLDVANGFDYVRLSMTVGTATSDAGAIVFGFDAAKFPAADLTSVDEIV